eukprot:m51a1_g5250 hypothetical protein (325) ;mRNA; f:50724-51851
MRKAWKILQDVHRACVEGDAAAVAAYLANPEEVAKVPLDSQDSWKDTFLAAAIRCRHHDIAKMLLDAGCSPDTAGMSSGDGGSIVSSLGIAVRANDVDAVKLLVHHGADLNAPDIACELIAAGASHSALGNRGCMDDLPLRAAAMRGSSTRTIRMLLEAGADPRAQPRAVSRSTMGSACSYSSLEAVKLLVQYGADVNAKVPGCNDSYVVPLYRACSRGVDFVEFLLDSGADLLDPTFCGAMVASLKDLRNKEDILPTKTLLFRHGANPYADDDSSVLMMKAVRAEMATAFACGHHTRLGARSPVMHMDRATMLSIFQLIFWRH